ncbi:unnamed protein product [Chrysoparadoxa australica]
MLTSTLGARLTPLLHPTLAMASLPNTRLAAVTADAAPACLATLLTPPASVPHLAWDIGAAVTCTVAATAWVKLWSILAKSGKIDPVTSRKVIHITGAPFFMLLWPFFTSHPSAKLAAAVVPLLQAVRLTLAGLTRKEDKNDLAYAVSRSGDPSEALQGPLTYTLIVTAAILLEWRTSVVGIMTICQIAAGDGVADLAGRRWGKKKWWFSKEKSYAGSLGFLAAAFAMSTGMIAWFNVAGALALTAGEAWGRVLLISAACSLVEVLPIEGLDDNVTVPVTAAALSRVLF